MGRLSYYKRRVFGWGYLVVTAFVVTGCSFMCSPPPKGPCAIDSLLIDGTSLPESVFRETGSRSADGAPARIGIEKIGTVFGSFDKGGVTHDVYRFAKESEATQEYENVSKYYFLKQKSGTDWEQPDDLNDLPLHADKFKVACSTITNIEPDVEMCQFVAQYGPYETYLTADMIALDHNDFTILIAGIDQKMVTCLDRK